MFKRYFAPESEGNGGSSGDQPAAAPATPAPAEQVSEWYWSEGLKGNDQPPEWYDVKKYKSVAEQARALPESRKRIGSLEAQVNELTGKLSAIPAAPETYEFKMPEHYANVLEVKADDPLMNKLVETGKKYGLSQEAFDAVYALGADLIYNYEVIDPKQMKEQIGENADERMKSVRDWAGSNLNEEQMTLLNESLSSWQHPSQVFKMLESVIAGKRQPPLPSVSADAAQNSSYTLAEVEREQNKTNERGERLFDIDPSHRAKVRDMRRQVVGDQPYQQIVGRRA